MTSVFPWLFYVVLGFFAAFLLDADGAVPFFAVWGLVGILLAIEADKALKQRKDQGDGGRPNKRGSRTNPNKAMPARRDADRQQPMEFSRC